MDWWLMHAYATYRNGRIGDGYGCYCCRLTCFLWIIHVKGNYDVYIDISGKYPHYTLDQQEWRFMGKSWGISWLKAAHVAGDLDIALKHINDMSHIKIVEEFCLPALRWWSTQQCVRNLSSIVYDSNFPSSIKQCSKPLLVDYYMGYTTLNYVILCYTTSTLSYPIVLEDDQNPWPATSHKIVWVHPHSILISQSEFHGWWKSVECSHCLVLKQTSEKMVRSSASKWTPRWHAWSLSFRGSPTMGPNDSGKPTSFPPLEAIIYLW